VSAVSAALDAQVARLARNSGGVVGVAAWRLDGTGPKLLLNADQAFPMASTFKVAVAARILERVDKGELTLAKMLTVRPEHFVPSDVIADRFIHPGVALSVHNLLELMLTQSDNSATDVLTEAAGGPAAVTDWLRRQGVSGQRIDRDTNGLLRFFYGLSNEGTPIEAFEAASKTRPDLLAKSDKADPAFDDDPRDSSTPVAMADLLTRLFNGKALTPASTKVLTDIMARCRTGADRLSGRLPPNTPVAHKTGTIGGTVNDVGVITLPDGGRLVIAAFVKKSTAPYAARERAIAEIARTAFDYFLTAAPR
jgi:beta-lactamase class A